MASPPSYNTSPPAPSNLTLPRQRPTLSLPTANVLQRKTSITSATSSSHPLRQTSFPPPDRYGSPGGGDSNALYSPTDSAGISDSELNGEISGAVGDAGEVTRKRKRGEKRSRGRPPKQPRASSQSLVNGTDDGKGRRSTAVGGSLIAGDGDAEDDEDDDDDDGLAAGDRAGAYEQDRFIANDRARIDLHQQMPVAQQERHDSWHRAKLKTADVRRLVNQTLSQSVPANVVTVVQAYTKMFAGLLIEGAREVQSEWMAVESQKAGAQSQSSSATALESTQTQGDVITEPDTDLSQAIGLRRQIEECDRPPLSADHLRESLRRYKKSRYGGVVGFTGTSLEGRDVAAARTGGRRMFR